MRLIFQKNCGRLKAKDKTCPCEFFFEANPNYCVRKSLAYWPRISCNFLQAAFRVAACALLRCFSQVAAKRTPVYVVGSISCAFSTNIPHRPSHNSEVQAIVSVRSSWRLSNACCNSVSVSATGLCVIRLWSFFFIFSSFGARRTIKNQLLGLDPIVSQCETDGKHLDRYALSHIVRRTDPHGKNWVPANPIFTRGSSTPY